MQTTIQKAKQVEQNMRKFSSGDWIITMNSNDTSLKVSCQNLKMPYKLHAQYVKIPTPFSFCQTFPEVMQILESNQSLTIEQKTLFIDCKLGKITKKLKLQLEEETISMQDQLKNKQKLLQLQMQKVRKLNNRVEQLQKQLKNEKSKNQKLTNIIEKFVECTKWGCSNLIPKDQVEFRGRSGPVCTQAHVY